MSIIFYRIILGNTPQSKKHPVLFSIATHPVSSLSTQMRVVVVEKKTLVRVKDNTGCLVTYSLINGSFNTLYKHSLQPSFRWSKTCISSDTNQRWSHSTSYHQRWEYIIIALSYGDIEKRLIFIVSIVGTKEIEVR